MKTILNWGLFVLVIAGMFFVAGPSSLGGPASYVIVSGSSMEPTYSNGDLVVAYQRDSYDVGDIVVYDADVEGQYNVIHRVIEVVEDGYRTQGDNRDRPDGWIASEEKIYGASTVHIPFAGRAFGLLRQPRVLLALLAWAGAFYWMSNRERGRHVAPDRGKHIDNEQRTTLRWARTAGKHAAAPKPSPPTSFARTFLGFLTIAALAAALSTAFATTLSVDAGTLQGWVEDGPEVGDEATLHPGPCEDDDPPARTTCTEEGESAIDVDQPETTMSTEPDITPTQPRRSENTEPSTTITTPGTTTTSIQTTSSTTAATPPSDEAGSTTTTIGPTTTTTALPTSTTTAGFESATTTTAITATTTTTVGSPEDDEQSP